MSDKRKAEKEAKQHVGTVEPHDRELAIWLRKLWSRGEPPSRLEVWQMFGKNKLEHGQLVHHEDFKPNTNNDIEACANLTNDIYAAAQNDCDTKERKMYYQIEIIDDERNTTHLTRGLGPLTPKSHFLAKTDDNTVPDDEEEITSQQALALKYNQQTVEAGQFDKNYIARIFGDMYQIQSAQVKEAHKQVNELTTQVRGLLKDFVEATRAREEALSAAEDRRLHRLWNEFLIDGAKDVKRTAINLLPGLFGPQQTQLPGNGGSAPKTPTITACPERALIDNIFHDCEEIGASVKLFGECEIVNNEIQLIDASKPGIFTLAQLKILLGVRTGQRPVEDLLALLPDSGKPEAITSSQIKEAQPNITEGIGTALLELMSLCQQRYDAMQETQEQEAQKAQQAQAVPVQVQQKEVSQPTAEVKG